MVLSTATLLGWKDPSLSKSRRVKIAKAACQLVVAYDFCFKKPLAYTQLPLWEGADRNTISKGAEKNPLSPQHSGSTSYVDQIEENCPTSYLHRLYWYSIKVLGAKASFAELADIIKIKSGAAGELRPTLNLSAKQWVQENGQN
jgi:hypothetical protein